MLKSFPKIFAIGSKQSQDLFDGPIEITEKLDGSAIGFGIVNGDLFVRSKNCLLDLDNPDKMFYQGIEVIKYMFNENRLKEGRIYYGEYFNKPKHNTLAYDRIPFNNIALYAVYDIDKDMYCDDYATLADVAMRLGIETVGLLYKGHYPVQKNGESSLIANLMATISFLGGQTIEGIVIKNYAKDTILAGHYIPILMGKYVSEQFKEVHKSNWAKENTGKGRYETYKNQFNSLARWHKAVQHLRDSNQLLDDPKDIPNLIKDVYLDIESEEKENIKEWLWEEFGKPILKSSTKGLAEWYKQQLLKEALDKSA